MKTRNNAGPRTEPCGTPLTTGTGFDMTFLTFTACALLSKNSAIQEYATPSTPLASNFESSLLFETVKSLSEICIKHIIVMPFIQ